MQALAAVMISHKIDCDGRKPSADLSLAAKTDASLVGLEKAFLCECFSKIWITGGRQQKSKDSALVPANHCVEIAEFGYDIVWMRYLQTTFPL